MMIDLYFWTTPNGYKIPLFLEEAGVAYNIVPVNISKGEQFDPEFLKISLVRRLSGRPGGPRFQGLGTSSGTACDARGIAARHHPSPRP